jgi:hypothetical protein
MITPCKYVIPLSYVMLLCHMLIIYCVLTSLLSIMSVKTWFTRHNFKLSCYSITILTSRMLHMMPFLHVLIMFLDNVVLMTHINKAILLIFRYVAKSCCYVARHRRYHGRCEPTPRLGPASPSPGSRLLPYTARTSRRRPPASFPPDPGAPHPGSFLRLLDGRSYRS